MLRSILDSAKGRSDVGGKPMGKTEYFFGAALGLVIVGSLIITIFFSTKPSNGMGGDGIAHYKCYSCGAEFKVNPNEEVDNPKAQP